MYKIELLKFLKTITISNYSNKYASLCNYIVLYCEYEYTGLDCQVQILFYKKIVYTIETQGNCIFDILLNNF